MRVILTPYAGGRCALKILGGWKILVITGFCAR